MDLLAEPGVLAAVLAIVFFAGIVQAGGSFSAALRATAVVGSRHHHVASEALHVLPDAGVVGGYEEAVQAAGALGLLVDPLKHRFAVDFHQRFARKTGRSKSSGTDTYGFLLFASK